MRRVTQTAGASPTSFVMQAAFWIGILSAQMMLTISTLATWIGAPAMAEATNKLDDIGGAMTWLYILGAWLLLQPTVVWLAYSRAIHKHKGVFIA